MARTFKSDDEGKQVLTADGDMVGTVDRASGRTATISPEESLTQSIRRRLGWSEEGKESYELDSSNVDRFSGNEIHLKRNM